MFPTDSLGTAFEVAVYRALMAVPYGTTISYGELAIQAGYPGAARAVGSAMSKQPVAAACAVPSRHQSGRNARTVHGRRRIEETITCH
ncbi:MAG: methylated-DNA--[protein]-cysteine S-methyltransferase [Bacillus subtilis]|nr:methylated-DNA--[protein]-cysteine S-methyltransferase [Bacillus subtilis]